MRLWSLGSNGRGQLALNHVEDTNSPERCQPQDVLEHSSNILSFACGGNHTLFINDRGELYAAGSNKHLELGLAASVLQEDLTRQFSRIHTHLSWKTVACGFNYTILVTSTDDVYVMGSNEKHTLGHAQTPLGASCPLTRLPCDMTHRHITMLRASLSHVVMVLSDHSIWGWGTARHGALGNDHRDAAVVVPTRLHLLPLGHAPRHLALGKDWTIVVTEDAVHHFGRTGRWNMLPNHVNVSRVQSVHSNWSTVHFLMQDGSIKSFGRHDRGQFAPTGLPPIKALASGSEHCLALGMDDTVYAWGWNEHGNCGLGTEDVTHVNQLHGRATGIAAGYGTSFIWCS